MMQKIGLIARQSDDEEHEAVHAMSTTVDTTTRPTMVPTKEAEAEVFLPERLRRALMKLTPDERLLFSTHWRGEDPDTESSTERLPDRLHRALIKLTPEERLLFDTRWANEALGDAIREALRRSSSQPTNQPRDKPKKKRNRGTGTRNKTLQRINVYYH
jgi:hypothetical protein